MTRHQPPEREGGREPRPSDCELKQPYALEREAYSGSGPMRPPQELAAAPPASSRRAGKTKRAT